LEFFLTLFYSTPEGACQTYLSLQTADNLLALASKEHCEGLWQDFKDLADVNFLTQFPLHLHQRWFEMYLTVALIRSEYTVECPKPGPDILVTIGDQRIWIEATCATAGEPGLPASVPPPTLTTLEDGPTVTDKPINEMALRISNSLNTKQEAFRHYIESGIVSPDDVMVVAINIGDIPGAGSDIVELMCRTLYGLGDTQLTIDKESSPNYSRRVANLTVSVD
jgi:type I restriction enzyme S subunit